MDKEIRISAVVLARNEVNNIEKCLFSLHFCDEIIVIDDNSTDNTVEKARKYASRIITRNLNNDFTQQRNFALGEAKGEWILFVDADEEVSYKLEKEIVSGLEKGTLIKKAYFVPRRDYWWGRELKYGEVLEARRKGFIRLVKRNSGRWMGKVHEKFAINAVVGQFRSHLNHFPHPTLKDFLGEVNHYSTIRANELLAQGKKTSIFEIVSFPLFKFAWNYFIKFGFLDRSAGFAYSFLMSFHSFLVRAKLFQYTKFSQEE